MEIQTIKTEIYQLVDHIQDTTLLKTVYDILKNEEGNTGIVAYTAKGEPLTKTQYVARIRKAQEQVKNGEVITVEDLEKESETW